MSRPWLKFVGVALLFVWKPVAGTAADDSEILPPASGRPLTVEAILPADVLARVQLLRDEVELLRREMGRPENVQPEMRISGAAPREVYFQAITLFEKADRLAFEHTGVQGKSPELVPTKQVRPFHVWGMVHAALERIHAVKEKFGLTERLEEKPAPVEIVPSQVFTSIVQANRQINLLLERQFAPRDVYREVSLSIHYAARLLAQYPGVERIPDPPPFERFKRPSDVFKALLDCFRDVRQMAAAQELTMLQILEDHTSAYGVSPSDVYDMAALLVSELSYLHAQVPGAEPPVPAYDPGSKFPSHVYQRVGVLQKQLNELLQRAESGE